MFNQLMNRDLAYFIGFRYAFSKRSDGYLSFISGFSFVAMALGVMALIIVLSVMNGFDREIKQRLLRVIPHITLVSPQGLTVHEVDQLQLQLSSHPDVNAVFPLLQTHAMASTGEARQGIIIQGIDPNWTDANDLADHLIAGHIQRLQAGEFGIVLGSQLARRLNVFIGDNVEIVLPQVSLTPLGAFPRLKMMQVVGIFEVGAQVDSSLAFIHQGDARLLLRLGERYQGMQIQLDDAYRADSLIAEISALSPANSQWQSWTELMGDLFTAMRMEKTVVSLLLAVIIAVAAFNIIASLVLMVADKRKDIAVLRTLGARSDQIVKLFVVQGTSVGVVGILVGAVLGCLIAWLIGDIVAFFESLTGAYLFDPSVYMISSMPSQVRLADVVAVVTVASLMSFLATLYPAWRAGQILPVEALRYD
jgi:lipoprotein-releasing system permease protein